MLAAAAGLAEVFRDEVEDVGQSSEDDHVSKVGDGNTEHGGEDLLGDQLAQHEEACADEDGSSDVIHGDSGSGVLGLDFQRLVLDAEQLAVAGHLRESAANEVHDDSHQDGDDIAQSEDGHAEAQVACGVLTGGVGVDLSHRHGTGARAAAHDGQDVRGDEVERVVAEDEAGHDAEHAGTQQGAQQRGDVQGAGFDKDITVDAQQGADDEEGDEDVQEAVAVDPAVGDIGDALGQEVEVLEQTGSEEAEHCAAAEELVPDGQALADLTDQDAEGKQDGDRADHLVGDDVEVGAGQHDDGEKRIDGKGHSIELNGIQFLHCCFLRFTGQYPAAMPDCRGSSCGLARR